MFHKEKRKTYDKTRHRNGIFKLQLTLTETSVVLDVVIYKDISVNAPKFESEKRYWIVSVYSY